MASPLSGDGSTPSPLRFPSLRFEESFQGSSMLEELPMRFAVILWEVHQDLHKWALASRNVRVKLFQEGAAAKRRQQIEGMERVDPLLREGLEVATEVLADPSGADPLRIARACEWIAAWAEERKAPYTRFWFTLHAAACARDGMLFYRAACIARDSAWWEAAEVNFQCATLSAKRTRNRQAQVMALIGLGNMHYRRCQFDLAMAAQREALRLAKRSRLREFAAAAQHELFLVSSELDHRTEAELFARAALLGYGPHNPRLLRLAHDVAYYWNKTQRFGCALPVLTALLPSFSEDIRSRVHILGTLARAAGGCGDGEAFERASSEVLRVHEHPGVAPVIAYAAAEVAQGAMSLGDWPLALRTSALAMEIARKRGEEDVLVKAEAVHHDASAAARDGISHARPGFEDWQHQRSRLAREILQLLAGGAV
jgi:tetratricopeptide (TPR) repeat protein